MPVAISIPSIGLNHTVGSIGGSSVLDPAPGTVSWYNQRAAPGQNGIAVILGHVTYNGIPDVFYSLKRAPIGSSVIVKMSNGGTLTFVVESIFSKSKEAMRHDARVWGTSSTPRLALVTCDTASTLYRNGHRANNTAVVLRLA